MRSLSLPLLLWSVVVVQMAVGPGGFGPDARAAQDTPAAAPAEKRPAWTASRVTGTPEPPPPYRIEPSFPHLQFDKPVTLTHGPVGDRLFVMELGGRVYSFPNDPACRQVDLFIDLAVEIEGLFQSFGLAFHPRFEENGYCYICYRMAPGLPDGTRVSRFIVRGTDPPVCDPASELVLLEWLSGGHNGGSLKFGPRDGYLYISAGDGAGPNPPDTLDTGQDVSDLLSSILRIDVDRTEEGRNYRIPPDNPFVDLPGARPELWAYGFRNPWKMSFDLDSGELWVGDVGWELWELVYNVERGGNYGWSVVEGPQPVRPESRRGPTPILPPAVIHPHTEAASVTGGYVYRGTKLPELAGAYIYGDYVSGKIWGLRLQAGQVAWHEELTDTTLQIIDFGEDRAGELFVMDHGGAIYHLVAGGEGNHNPDFPRTLGETGLFSSVEKHTVAPGVVPYQVHVPLWQDGATAERYVALPGAEAIDVLPAGFTWPADSVLMRTVSLETLAGEPASRRRIETQLLHYDGAAWRGYTYRWNEEQSDARLVEAAGETERIRVEDVDVPGGVQHLSWRYHSRSECATCHNPRAGYVLGFIAPQLEGAVLAGSAEVDQRDALTRLGVFRAPAGRERKPQPSFAGPDNARAYLHVNCAHCHRRGGGGTAPFELRYELALEKTETVDAPPTQGAFGIHDARVIAPGDPYRSVLYYRMAKLGSGRMPHLGSETVDREGLQRVVDWIRDLGPTPVDPADPSKLAPDVRRMQTLLFRSASAPEQDAAVAELLNSTSGALRLVEALDEQLIHGAQAEVIVRAGAAHPSGVIRDLFERFLPEKERTKRLGTAVDVAAVAAVRGDAERGRKLFFETQGIQCKACHRIGGEGSTLGPDLSGIGKKYDRRALLESILDPSRSIEPKYAAYLVETVQGRVLSGLLAERTESEVALRDAEDKLVRIPKADVEQIVPQPKSLMPDGLLRDMTPSDVADLLEYLSTLTAPAEDGGAGPAP